MDTRQEQKKTAMPVLESAMQTGQDDGPEMTVGDKHTGDAPHDLSVDEAEELLGGDTGSSTPQVKKKTEGKDGDNI